jgi:ABC-type phosphate/phosphonate transport system permease subunit
MASAWAHVASYGSMIVMSFILARKYYFIDYNLIKILPYFVLAIPMVIFAVLFDYGNTVIELTVNSGFIAMFIIYAQYKDKLISVFFRKE